MSLSNKPPGSLTFEEIVTACRNIGVNLECGGCASAFFTGYGGDPHDDNCTRKSIKLATVKIDAEEAVRAIESRIKEFISSIESRYLDIVFDGEPDFGHDEFDPVNRSGIARFVEVESPAGTGVKVGEWIDRGDGYCALRLTLADFLTSKPECAPEHDCGMEAKSAPQVEFNQAVTANKILYKVKDHSQISLDVDDPDDAITPDELDLIRVALRKLARFGGAK